MKAPSVRQVLLGVWGPIVTSVGSLLTIVLVFISDAIFGGCTEYHHHLEHIRLRRDHSCIRSISI